MKYTVTQKNPDSYDTLARLRQNAQMSIIFDRDNQLHFISLSASNKFNAVEIRHLDHLKELGYWWRCGLTLNRRLSIKRSTSVENDFGPV